jgi:hypothetical protein
MTRRFMLSWILATVPATWLGQIALSPLIAWLATSFLSLGGIVTFWVVFCLAQLAVTLGAAIPQSIVLARHRRRVPGWVWAAIAAHVAGYLLYYSVSRGMAGLMPAGQGLAQILWTLILGTTWPLAFSVAEAVALWGRRWPPSWILWVAGRICVALILAGAALAVNRIPGAPTSVIVQAFLPLAYALPAAAAMAWLLDRAVFGPEAAQPLG